MLGTLQKRKSRERKLSANWICESAAFVFSASEKILRIMSFIPVKNDLYLSSSGLAAI